MSEEQMIRHCAPTLACMKSGSLFACPCATKEAVIDFVRNMNRRLKDKGLCILPFQNKSGRFLIYVYRPQMLEQDLQQHSAKALLEDCGYTCKNVNCCLRRLITRLAQEESFPHEIGLFLNYPPEDVYGFIHHKDEAKFCGYWKVYGDVDAAKQTFSRYKKCSDLYMRLWTQGHSIEQLTVSA